MRNEAGTYTYYTLQYTGHYGVLYREYYETRLVRDMEITHLKRNAPHVRNITRLRTISSTPLHVSV